MEVLKIKDQKVHKLEHKILHGLLNEALPIVLGPPLAVSSFRRKLCRSFVLQPASGKELLKLVWDIILVSLYPPFDTSSNSLDNLVDGDLGSIPWSALISDEITILERQTECLIAEDLVKELRQDILCSKAYKGHFVKAENRLIIQ
ncbi:hypothetical protein L6164_005671 [Bauhinia variegata]|uniref:Uncharacterized protein n=1 Tax=Bauhinia variegata TaxID=167791 RepID=A0ACB9PR95_BAUVA|nr:hypothetical protein L6164_005671 [Bauhinia variegata]